MTRVSAENETLIYQIAVCTQSTPDEVIEFYRAHAYSLEDIKIGVALCGKLDKTEIDRALIMDSLRYMFFDNASSFKEFELGIAPSQPGKPKQKKQLRFGPASKFKREMNG